mmetsp:Transcript_9836/g.37085  ORF Transcript_9836/g.37085 Transcript_9836/m.37085 type:complete len:361 (-) Transcript_9836:321-1403(-)
MASYAWEGACMSELYFRKVCADQLGHLKHGHACLSKYALQGVIAQDLPTVLRVLQGVLPYVHPKLLRHFRPLHLCRSNNISESVAQVVRRPPAFPLCPRVLVRFSALLWLAVRAFIQHRFCRNLRVAKGRVRAHVAQVHVDQLRNLEHRAGGQAEHFFAHLVPQDRSPIVLILQTVLPDVDPNLLGHLRSRQLLGTDNSLQCRGDLIRFTQSGSTPVTRARRLLPLRSRRLFSGLHLGRDCRVILWRLGVDGVCDHEIWVVDPEVLGQVLVDGEERARLRLEELLEGLVQQNPPAVPGILQIVLLDVGPDALRDLRPRHFPAGAAQEIRQALAQEHFLLETLSPAFRLRFLGCCLLRCLF